MSKTKILCSGTCGFIGGNFVRHVFKENLDYEIVSIDKIASPINKNSVYYNRSHKFYIADITDNHIIDKIFEIEKPDIVINFAALTFVDDAIKDAKSFVHNNVYGTQILIDVCLKHNVKKIVQISTDECLGQLELNDKAWTEESMPNPRNAYSASKLSAEYLIKAAYETHGLQYNITRCCNNFGPKQSTKNLIPKIIKNILDNEKVPIYGKGDQIREWLFVNDHCSALIKILEKGASNETYNISCGYEISNLELFNMICNIMEKGHNLLEFVEDRKGHDFRYAIDSTKLKSLGWKPNFKFRKGLEHTVEWYVNNKWFRDIKNY